MYKVYNLINNPNVELVDEKGSFSVIEHVRDFSGAVVDPQKAYYESQMGVRKRQLVCDLNKSGLAMEAGRMLWMVGDVELVTGVKGIADYLKKAIRSRAAETKAVTSEYTGNGLVVSEPIYQHIVLMDTADWGGEVTLADGMFFACETSVKQVTVARNTVSSAAVGNSGLLNLGLSGNGIVALRCPCPKEEIIEIELENDTLKIDGSFAVAWSSSLRFTVERSAKSLIDSAMTEEGLVNVYRGTGIVWTTPLLQRKKAQIIEQTETTE